MSDKVIKCLKCDQINSSSDYFCKECGCFFKKADFQHKQIADLPEMKMLRIIENMDKVPHNPIVWNDVIDLYVTNVERLVALYGIEDLGNDKKDSLMRKLYDFLDLCSKAEFQIAFVGTIKTGKSTLINSLLGSNYASTSVTPETAVLTKFRSSAKDYIKIQFYKKAEWEKLWASRTSAADVFEKEYKELKADKQKSKWIDHADIYKELTGSEIKDELTIWSSSKHAEHYFVKEIEVGISSLPSNFPKQVVFVDTPGLSDPVVYRSEITKDYIRKANAVFVCVDAKKVYKEEVETIASVFSFSAHNKEKVHIIATQWDTLNFPIEDWETQKEYLLKRFVGKAFFDTTTIAKQNIIHSSALMYNLCRDFNKLSDKEIRSLAMFCLKLNLDINVMDRNDILKNMDFIKLKTNIDTLIQVIQNRLISNYKTILYKDITVVYKDVCLNVQRISNENRESINGFIKAIDASIKDRLEMIKKHERSIADIKSSQNQLLGWLSLVENKTNDNVKLVQKLVQDRIQAMSD